MGKILDRILYIERGGKEMNSITRRLLNYIKGYNHQKYWHRRSVVTNPHSKVWLPIKLYYLYYIKKQDGKHGCSFGMLWNGGAKFVTPQNLPHGPYGIIVGNDVIVGRKCNIYHQVTIAGGNVKISDNVELGAGSKVLPNVHIGDCCHVGANAVVVEDMPDYSTCVMQKPRIINK